MAKRLIKKKPASGRVVGQARSPKRTKASKQGTKKKVGKKRSVKAVRQARSLAAQKGWETRRRNARVLEKKLLAVKRRRSAAAKKGWASRRKTVQLTRREAQLAEREPLLERKDLRPELPAKFEALTAKRRDELESSRRKIISEDRAELRKLDWVTLLTRIRSPKLRQQAEYSGNLKEALKIAYQDLDAYWDVQFERMDQRQSLSQQAVLKHFQKVRYGTELEAYRMVDDVFRILTTTYGATETNESKLRRQLKEAFATPQFDAVMEVKAEELGWTKREMYSWWNGSPEADLFL
jgi:hypothetical protein